MIPKRTLFDLATIAVIVVVSDRLLLGIVAVLLLRILEVLIAIRNTLPERPAGENVRS